MRQYTDSEAFRAAMDRAATDIGVSSEWQGCPQVAQ